MGGLRPLARSVPVVVALLAGAACATSPIVSPARLAGAEDEPPRIQAPAPASPRRLLTHAAKAPALPAGMRGWLPAHEGDPILVVLTPTAGKTPTSERVRDEVIAPILRAIGFTRGVGALRRPPPDGVALPRPEFAPLARAVALEYAADPRLLRPETQEMLDVFLGAREPDADVDRALLLGEGMTFAQYRAGIERREIVFPFQQVHCEPARCVLIEHALLMATAWEGESVRSVQGALLGDYLIANAASLDPGAVVTAAHRSLLAVRGIERASVPRPAKGPTLVLLPFGTDAGGRPLLRYAYRMQQEATWRGRPARFLLWADAGDGKLLALEPLTKAAGAQGRTFNRDAGQPGAPLVQFQVDAPTASGEFMLVNANASVRLNYRGDGYNASEVTILAGGNGSTTSFANFDQPPINALAGTLCAEPVPGGHAPNPAFQQVSLFATLMRHRDTIRGAGTFEPYPDGLWAPTVEYSPFGCNADQTMTFGACSGYWSAACPDAPDELLNFAHDNTMVAHEIGHSANSRLVEGRPWDWCAPGGPPDCDLPQGWGLFHDLADFWGAHLESTNCIGGWVAKNVGGTNASLYCSPKHSERDWFPRKLEVTVGATTGDHFPEHRDPMVGGVNAYADGQIAGAALWEVRVGMRSKCRPSGVPQFGVRFQRALMHSGFFDAFVPDSTDLGMYRRLVELLLKMVEQWATAGLPGGPPAFAHNGAHTTNKVTAGFARAGIFLVPWQCLDADPSNDTILTCPAANPGADAVVDVDDGDPADDDPIVDRDFLRAGGPAPVFHVWTGPRYRLDGPNGQSTMLSPAPCNDEFHVEATTDPTFATVTATSPWTRVNRLPTGGAPTCYGTWSPNATEWAALQAGGVPSRIYYRARTRDASGGTVRLSTEPGNGLWSVPPPYAVITSDGRSDY